MKHFVVFVLCILATSLAAFLAPSAYAALPGCQQDGGTCNITGACPSNSTPDYSEPGCGPRRVCCFPNSPRVCHNDAPFTCPYGFPAPPYSNRPDEFFFTRNVYICSKCVPEYRVAAPNDSNMCYGNAAPIGGSFGYSSKTDFCTGPDTSTGSYIIPDLPYCGTGGHYDCNGVRPGTTDIFSGRFVSGYAPHCVANIVSCTTGLPVGGGGGAPPTYTLSGQVFVDNNRNYTRDGSPLEPVYQGATITLSGSVRTSRSSNSSGNYSFGNLPAGTYTVTLTVPSGFVNVSSTQYTNIRLGPNAPGRNFAIVNIYTISGSVFNDISKDTYKNNGETKDWPENLSLTSKTLAGVDAGTMSINSAVGAGTYTVSNLFAGTYDITNNSGLPPGGYFLIFPLGSPPTLRLTVGPNCSNVVNLSAGHRCSNGNLTDTNFAISNSIPWMQSYGFDMRLDEGFEDKIPTNPLYPPYASVSDKLINTTSTFITQGTLPSNFNGQDLPNKVYVNGLTPGSQYRVVVSSHYRYERYTSNRETDAQWDDSGGAVLCYCRRINKVRFNGVDLDASDYQTVSNPAHDYTYLVTVTNSQLEMYVTDGYYGDNLGSLSYKLYTN